MGRKRVRNWRMGRKDVKMKRERLENREERWE